MKRYLPFVIIVAVALLAVGAGIIFYRTTQKRVAAPPPPVELPSPNAGAQPPHFRGAPKASVVLEEFADLQCPPCAALSVGLKKMEHEYSGRIKVIFRHFPMAMHNHAVEAAQATEAAAIQGRFWEMNDLLYENQIIWSKAADVQPLFEEYAQKIGLDLVRFKADLASQPVLARIGLDTQRGTSLDVKATPTLFINNQRVPVPSMNEAGLRAAIDTALAGNEPFPTK